MLKGLQDPCDLSCEGGDDDTVLGELYPPTGEVPPDESILLKLISQKKDASVETSLGEPPIGFKVEVRPRAPSNNAGKLGEVPKAASMLQISSLDY
jgi:hypothetical protein